MPGPTSPVDELFDAARDVDARTSTRSASLLLLPGQRRVGGWLNGRCLSARWDVRGRSSSATVR